MSEEKSSYKYLEMGYSPKENRIYRLDEFRTNLLEALQGYRTRLLAGGSAPTHFLIARIETFFVYNMCTLKDFWTKEKYDEVKNKVWSKDIDKVIEAFMDIDQVLYDTGILKFTEPPDAVAAIGRKSIKKKYQDSSEVWE